MNENLTSKTVHGIKWSSISAIVNTALQVGFTAVMARLLEPASFGLMAMASVVLRFAQYFAQMGIGSALIQKKNLSHDDICAAFTSSLFLGSAIFIIIWVLAPFVRYIFNDKEVIPVIRGMAISFVFSGLSITALSIIRRNMDFKKLAVIEITSYVLGYGGVGVPLAFIGFKVWSLVLAVLSQTMFSAILSYALVRHPVSLKYDWKYHKPLYSFGSRVSVIGFFEFLGSNLDTLAIGRFIGSSALGIYNRAFMLVNLPLQYFVNSLTKVLFPSYSRIQADVPKLRRVYLSSFTVISFFLLPSCIGMAVASREIVLVVLGGKWASASPILQVLAFGAFFSLSTHLAGVFLEATAALYQKMIIQIAFVIFLGTLFYLLRNFGIIGLAFAVTIGEFVHFIAYSFIVCKMIRISLIEMLNTLKHSLYSGLAVAIVIQCLAYFFRRLSTPTLLLFMIELLGGASLILILLRFLPENTVGVEVQRILSNVALNKVTKSIISKLIKNVV